MTPESTDILSTYELLMRHAYGRQLANDTQDCSREEGACSIACSLLGCVRHHHRKIREALEERKAANV